MSITTPRLAATAIAVAAVLATAPASAYFRYQEVPEDWFENDPGDGPVTQIGAGNPGGSVSGYGSEIPVYNALEMITPDDWQVRARGLDDATLSWSGGDTWTEVLENTADEAPIRYLVDWNRKILMAAPAEDIGETADEYQDLADKDGAESSEKGGLVTDADRSRDRQAAREDDSAARGDDDSSDDIEAEPMASDTSDSGNNTGGSTDPDQLVTDHTSGSSSESSSGQSGAANWPEWRLRPGGLRPQLEQWAERADYELVWRAPRDFMIEANVSFDGTFVDAFQRLVRTMNDEGTPIIGSVHRSNRVAVVEAQ